MRKVAVLVALLGVVAGVGWLFWSGGGKVLDSAKGLVPGMGAWIPLTETTHVVPPIVNEYRNDEFRFSLSMPEEFSTGELLRDGNGASREVWFVHKGFLYEVTTYKALDSWLASIMLTWKFI